MKKVLFALLSMLLPGLAMAAVSGPFTPPATDVSMKVLDALFGNLGIFGAGGSDAFGAVMQIFNGAVLIVGGILATYTLLAGTLGTAHDGEMLGKKFSSVWIPIRYSLGTALVLPVINGQYATINWIVGWLLVQGAGLADSVWSTYMSSSNIKNQMSVGITPPSANALGYKIFGSLICMRGLEYIMQPDHNHGLIDTAVLPNNTAPVVGITKTDSPLYQIYNFGMPKGGLGFDVSSCGTVSVLKAQAPTIGKTDVDYTSIGGLLGNPTLAVDSSIKVAALNDKAVAVLINSLDSIATDWAAQPTTNPMPKIDKAIATYQETIKNNAADIVSKYMNLDELSESAKRDGWAFAGAYYMKISYLVDLASRTTASIPEATGMPESMAGKFSSAFNSIYVDGLKQLMVAGKPIGNYSINTESNSGGDKFSWTKWMLSGFDLTKIVKHLMQGIGTYVIDDGTNPILEMKRMGNWLIGTAATIKAAEIGASLLASPTQGTGIVIAMKLGSLIDPVAAVMVGVGFTLSFVIPMMPFMMWMGVLLGWLIMAVEAVVISSMWAVMHLHPNGDDLTGKGANGYSLVLSLMLRPTFAVFGMIASINIIFVLGTLVNKIFMSAFLLSQTDSNIIIMLISICACPFIYAGMMWTMIRKCMSITTSMADELLKWFGGNGTSLGRTAEELGGNGAGTYLAGATATKMAGDALSKTTANRLNKEKSAASQEKEQQERGKIESSLKGHKEGLDYKFGSGSGDAKFSSLGISSPQDFERKQAESMAYDRGLDLINNTGGENSESSISSFQEQMASSSQDGFSSYGGDASKAATSISQKIALDNVSNRVSSQYGDSAGKFLKASAMRTNSQGEQYISEKGMNNAGNFLNYASEKLGDNFKSILSNTVSKSDNPTEIRKMLESEIKMAETAQKEQKKDTQQDQKDNIQQIQKQEDGDK